MKKWEMEKKASVLENRKAVVCFNVYTLIPSD